MSSEEMISFHSPLIMFHTPSCRGIRLLNVPLLLSFLLWGLLADWYLRNTLSQAVMLCEEGEELGWGSVVGHERRLHLRVLWRKMNKRHRNNDTSMPTHTCHRWRRIAPLMISLKPFTLDSYAVTSPPYKYRHHLLDEYYVKCFIVCFVWVSV